VTLAAEKRRDLDSLLLTGGNGVLQVMQKFLAGRVAREEFLDTLAKINSAVESVVPAWWEDLVRDPGLVPHWQVLQTLRGLQFELSYQFAEYGESTLNDDMREIALNLKRIAGR